MGFIRRKIEFTSSGNIVLSINSGEGWKLYKYAGWGGPSSIRIDYIGSEARSDSNDFNDDKRKLYDSVGNEIKETQNPDTTGRRSCDSV